MEFVECSEKYWDFVRLLRMNEKVIDGFIKNDYISEEMQKKYMDKNSQFYRVAILNSEPVGFIGVIDGDIRICVHPDFHRKGVGKFMLKNCLKIWPDAFAKIKITNDVSLKFFESCGFVKKYYILENDTQSV
jgi:GNAT superfamily N-acetyltransferase